MFAFPLVLVAFSGLDASSGLAGQVAIGRRGLRRLISVRLLAALPYVGIALVASATLPVERIDEGVRGLDQGADAGDRGRLPQEWLREGLRYVVAVSAIAILAAACNAPCSGCRGSATRSPSTAISPGGSATCIRRRRRRW